MNAWLGKRTWSGLGAALLIVVVLAPVQTAAAQVVRGEAARLERQAYDYYFRNSNNNVFRRSRHFHPTKNVFRSSRYYQQRVRASTDGYPLRTIVRFTEHTVTVACCAVVSNRARWSSHLATAFPRAHDGQPVSRQRLQQHATVGAARNSVSKSA